MAMNSFLLLVLLASRSVLCQTALPDVEDNRSQVPLPDENVAKDMPDAVGKENAKEHNEVDTQPIQKDNLKDIVKLTTLPIVEKDSDFTSEPEAVVKPELKQQVPIFMNQHMVSVIEKQMSQQNKQEEKSASPSEVTVKSEPNHQAPIFMDQHLFNVVDKEMKGQDNVDAVVEATTEVNEGKADKPAASDNHRVPPFMDQQMMKGIMDFQKEVERLRQHKDVPSSRPNIHIPEPRDHYKNSIYLEGHHRGTYWHSNFASVLSSAMNQEMSFGANTVSVYPLATSFEYTSTGHKLTRFEYVVTYNGRVLAEFEVTKTLSRLRPSQSLREGLNNMHMSQYTKISAQTVTDSTTHSKMDAYFTPMIITIVTITVVIILLVSVVIIHVKRNRAEPPKPKDKKQLMKYILEADKRTPNAVEPINPPPYSAENPAYEV